MGLMDLFNLEEFVGVLQNEGRPPPPQPQPAPAPQPVRRGGYQARHAEPGYRTQTRTFYHGTSYEAAMDILYKGYWKIGRSRPKGIWLAETPGAAREYKERARNGRIIIMQVAPYVKLADLGKGYHVYEMHHAEENQHYQIPTGIIPTGFYEGR